MAGRSKVMGKPVADLTPRELQQERSRCEQMSKIYGNKIAGKLLRKRLYEIDRRLAQTEM